MNKSIVEIEKELASYKGDDRVIPFSEMKKELEKQPKGFVVHSYFLRLDELIQGFSEGELILVSGRAKSGKTTFLQTLTSHFAEMREKVLWFTYEVPIRQFLNSFPELPEGYTPRQLKMADIWWLERKIYESKLKWNTRIVMIDHIHYLIDMSKIRNSALEVGYIYRRLKLMAIKYHIIIFIISHLRKVEKGVEPQAEDIRDTNLALGEPDTVLMLWRVADDDGEIGNKAILKIVMTRRTGVLEKKIRLEKRNGYLEEI